MRVMRMIIPCTYCCKSCNNAKLRNAFSDVRVLDGLADVLVVVVRPLGVFVLLLLLSIGGNEDDLSDIIYYYHYHRHDILLVYSKSRRKGSHTRTQVRNEIRYFPHGTHLSNTGLYFYFINFLFWYLSPCFMTITIVINASLSTPLTHTIYLSLESDRNKRWKSNKPKTVLLFLHSTSRHGANIQTCAQYTWNALIISFSRQRAKSFTIFYCIMIYHIGTWIYCYLFQGHFRFYLVVLMIQRQDK